MRRGAILEAIRKENRNSVIAVLVLTALLAAVLLFNWKYMYNFAAGPFRFDAALAAAPGAREFVRAEGPLLPTGMSQETTFRLFRGAVETKSISANYMAMLAGDRFLMVKVKPEFSGKVVEGRLVPLPETIRASLASEAGAAGTEKAFYPYLLEQKSYRWDANLFVMIATPLFPLSLLLLAFVSWQAARVERHAALKRLSRLGPFPTVVGRVESALAAAGPKAKAGPLWITRDWLVGLGSSVLLYPAEDLVGVGLKTSATKSGPKHVLHFWAKGQMLADTLEVSAEEARAVLGALAERMPWTPKEDVAVFEKRWSDDRDACAREADAQRRASAAPGQPPSVTRS
jgi:hypothetical protein